MRKEVINGTHIIRALHRIVYENGMPNRVMLQDTREAHPPTPKDMEAVSEIYIRDDGWSIGANHRCAREVWRAWMGNWIVQLRKQTWGWQVNDLRKGEEHGA